MIYSINAVNPDSAAGETFNYVNWKSNLTAAASDIEQDWRNYTGCASAMDYLRTKNFKVAPATTYAESTKSAELEVIWEQVTDCIVDGTWNCIYAMSDGQFNMLLNKMINDANAYGYDKCLEWCEQEAARRHELEESVRK